MADHSPNSSNSVLDPLNHLLNHARIAAEADAERQRRIDETICEVREKVSRGEWTPLPMDYTDRGQFRSKTTAGDGVRGEWCSRPRRKLQQR